MPKEGVCFAAEYVSADHVHKPNAQVLPTFPNTRIAETPSQTTRAHLVSMLPSKPLNILRCKIPTAAGARLVRKGAA